MGTALDYIHNFFEKYLTIPEIYPSDIFEIIIISVLCYYVILWFRKSRAGTLLKGIFMIGKKRWKPASYVSFMEIMKNGRKQQFIMLFLILTLSMGMFHATVARTISQNARENRNYLDGADLVLEEVWDTNASVSYTHLDVYKRQIRNIARYDRVWK